ncbi:hypothetical protein [Lentibacillus kimchii]|uniref:Uncharacterized protein n=1 Tax=Lentibacillus kimchii TaxID=1542911 RepID=A0ABW2UYB4_9BACI
MGTVTIGSAVKAGTFFDPDWIAEAYWNLFTKHDQTEMVYQPNDAES